MQTQPTASSCFDELSPYVKEIQRLVCTAPLSEKDRAYLGMLVTGSLMGMMTALYQRAHPDSAHLPHSAIAQGVMNQILPMLDAAIKRARH